MITCSRKKDKLPSRLTGARKTTLGRNTSGTTEDEKNPDPIDRSNSPAACEILSALVVGMTGNTPHSHPTSRYLKLKGCRLQGLKNGKFREYTGRYKNRDDARRVRQRPNNPKPKTKRRNDEPRERGTHREIAMISGGILDEGNPPSKKVAKRSRHSCLAVEVMPRPLTEKPPPAIVFSSEEIKQTTNSMN
ncbi:hypothetical protein PIB30_044203 [Stylosanthes scabra]|uniref:Uncharacterized protein n=1 Tax=Stylosanthes scabra TaxID=79078 RepID=A0ABU6SGK7_9FABA|nr:hypothetical protein [Stylosanthes scabra]